MQLAWNVTSYCNDHFHRVAFRLRNWPNALEALFMSIQKDGLGAAWESRNQDVVVEQMVGP